MKNIVLILFSFALMISCNNKEEQARSIAEQEKEIAKKNEAIKEYNKGILEKRNVSKFKDISGNHAFSLSSDGISPLEGTVVFKKTAGDQYDISGSAKSGKNSITINGKVEVLTDINFNFEGEITQNIAQNGKPYTRKGDKTFTIKGKNKFWRLQDMVNDQGFVDYIDIHF